MELDELKSVWREYDRKLDRALAINQKILREVKTDKARRALHRFLGLPLYELLSGVAVGVPLVAFLVANWRDARYVASAVALLAVAAYAAVMSVRQLVVVGGIDYGAPVVAIQRELLRLRSIRIRTTLGLLLVAPLAWFLLAVVVAKGLVGLDVFEHFSPAWVLGNIGFGLAVIPLAIWISRRYGARLRGASFVKGLMDDIAGRSLVKATGFLNELSEFEREV